MATMTKLRPIRWRRVWDEGTARYVWDEMCPVNEDHKLSREPDGLYCLECAQTYREIPEPRTPTD
jgi:hypothetical protein